MSELVLRQRSTGTVESLVSIWSGWIYVLWYHFLRVKNSYLLVPRITLHAKFRGAPKKTADEEADALPASLSFPIDNAVAQPVFLKCSLIFKP